jgi:membrane protein implicated in regulation of membrane protease activity
MTNLLMVFLVIGGVGFLFLMISLIIGDLFEALDIDFGADVDFDTDVDFDIDADFDAGGGSSFGVFDTRVISVFLTAFGIVGAIALQFGLGGIISSLMGIGSGLLLGGLIFGFGYYLANQEATSPVTNRELVGRTAKVVVSIKPGSIGQISLQVRGERIEKLAKIRGEKEIIAGETVFIEERSGNSFIVSPMEGAGYDLLSEEV